MKLTKLFCVTLSLLCVGGSMYAKGKKDSSAAIRVKPSEEHYIFTLDSDVKREHVYYKNRFGIEIAADLYTAKNLDRNAKHEAVVIGPPFGGVKEQGPGVYAQQLAKRGFVALAFDPAYHGYSGGEIRNTGSSAMYLEDFSAGVDFLGSLKYVDREKIGALGICGSGCFAMGAATMDRRIKAVVTSAMYDIAGGMNSVPNPARTAMLDEAAASRWNRLDTGADTTRYSYPDSPVEVAPEGLTGDMPEFFEFYGMKRGWHYNARGNITGESAAEIMSLPTSTHIGELNRPILFVTGDIAHSRAFSENAYAAASEPKELYVVQGNVRHIDLYDDVSKIPFDKIADFFKTNLK